MASCRHSFVVKGTQMPSIVAGYRERIAIGSPPATETLRLSRCRFALGSDDAEIAIDGKSLGQTLRMAVVACEAQRRFDDCGGRDSTAYWERVWTETLAPDARADQADAWVAIAVGDRRWSDGAPKRYARVLEAAADGAALVEWDSQPAFELTIDDGRAVCVLHDRSLSDGDALRFELAPRDGRVLGNDAMAFAANLFDLSNLAGQVMRTAAEDGGDARFFDLLTRKRQLRDALRSRMRIVQRRALAAEKAYRVVFAPERPAVLKLADFDALSTADFMRVAARMLGVETAPRRLPQAAEAAIAAAAAQAAPSEIRAAG